jgi:hypothetical protein
MTAENPYAPPKTEVADAAAEKNRKPSAGARLAWTTGVALPVFLPLMFAVPLEKRGVTALGAALFALGAGLIGMCIPARRKVAFILPAILIVFVLAAVFGQK